MEDVNELYTSLTQLADGFRKRFNLSKNLTIPEMTKLVTPPKNPLLLEQGSFKFTNDHNKYNLTSNGGSKVSGFIVPAYYGENKTLLNSPATRPNLTLRLHFNVLKTDGVNIRWGIEGMGGTTSWNPNESNESDFNLNTGIMVDSNNSLEFDTVGTTIINLATSYIEIIVTDN